MPKFNKANINELKNYLYNNYIHDAKMECVSYNCQEGLLDIRIFNPIYNTTVSFIFHHVSLFLAIEGDEPGKQEEIFSLSVEENFSCLHQHIQLQYLKIRFQVLPNII